MGCVSRLVPGSAQIFVRFAALFRGRLFCELRACELRVASCELRVASCELRVASCELRGQHVYFYMKYLPGSANRPLTRWFAVDSKMASTMEKGRSLYFISANISVIL